MFSVSLVSDEGSKSAPVVLLRSSGCSEGANLWSMELRPIKWSFGRLFHI